MKLSPRSLLALMSLAAGLNGCLNHRFARDATPPSPAPEAAPALAQEKTDARAAEIAELQREIALKDAYLQAAGVGYAELTQRAEEGLTRSAELSERLKWATATVERLAIERLELTQALAEARARAAKAAEVPGAAITPPEPPTAPLPPPAVTTETGPVAATSE